MQLSYGSTKKEATKFSQVVIRTSAHQRRNSRGLQRLADFAPDPIVCLFKSDPEWDIRLPVKGLLNHGVVAIPAIHSLRGREIVVPFDLDAGDVLNDLNELIDRDQFAAAQIDRIDNVAAHDHLDALQAVIDVHEAASPGAITPDFDFMLTR